MKTFQEYIEEKTENKQSLFNKLINLSIEKYPKEVEDFLNLMSSKDSEIAQIIDKIKYLNEKFGDKDVVSSNNSDNNLGNEEVY